MITIILRISKFNNKNQLKKFFYLKNILKLNEFY